MSRVTTSKNAPLSPAERDLRDRARALGLYGLLARWEDLAPKSWVGSLLEAEEQERARRSLERRRRAAKLSRFKSLADFEWTWPTAIDREIVEELMRLRFMEDASNILLIGPNGVGKTMIAKNIADAAILAGKNVRFGTAAEVLNDLAAQPSAGMIERRLRRYVNPDLLIIDEVGYLATSSTHAEHLFQIVNRRYENKSTIITTNKPFEDWGDVFPDAACITTMVDRLVHRSELVVISGESYRYHEAEERQKKRRSRPKRKPPPRKTK